MNPEKLLNLVDRKLVIDLATELVDTASPTGEEGNMARALQRMFKEVGCDAHLQNIYDDRHNAIGRLPGTGSGPTILMSGHMDTSVRGDEAYLVGKGWKNQSVVEADRIWGNGICNMKNAFVSYIAGIDAMRRAGVKLSGELVVAGTAGEIEMAPVDEFQGKHYHGYGMGLRHMLIHGVAADYHFLGEPTAQVPSTGMMGTTWAKVSVHGDFAHSAFHDSTLSALDEMWLLWHELTSWIAEYKKQHTYCGVVPSVNRACMRGGLPWRAARTCNLAQLYVDIRFPPHRYPIDVQREFTEAVQRIAREKLQRPVEIDYYMSRPGTEIPATHPVVQSVVDAHRDTTGSNVPAMFCPPYCTDAIDANRLGIPTCVYGSGGTSPTAGPRSGDLRAKEGEFVLIDDMVNEAAVMMSAAMRLNDVPRDKLIAMRGAMPGVQATVAGSNRTEKARETII
jgi:acetylornithine deacetylase/succinyl-diaminopimelate desuccinylase-like protein